MLRNGTSAPHFSLPGVDGKSFEFSGAQGRITVLIFHRGVLCPTTDKFLTAYQDFYGRLKEMNISLVAISTDSVEDNRAIGERLKIRFPLLSDPDFSVCRSYGVYDTEYKGQKVFAEPALIISDVDGKVAYSVITSGPKGLPSPGDVAPVLLYMHTHEGRY